MAFDVHFTRAAAAALIGAVMAIAAPAAADATTINFSYAGMNGYTAAGAFTYNGTTAPATIVEAGGGATKAISSFSISFFNPANTLLETGSSVTNSISSDSFFRLTYNTVSNAITTLDADVGGSYQYFLTNLRTPTGSVVPPGVTGFNFFNRATANAALDTAPGFTTTVAPTAVPEPAALLELSTAICGLLLLRRRNA